MTTHTGPPRHTVPSPCRPRAVAAPHRTGDADLPLADVGTMRRPYRKPLIQNVIMRDLETLADLAEPWREEPPEGAAAADTSAAAPAGQDRSA